MNRVHNRVKQIIGGNVTPAMIICILQGRRLVSRISAGTPSGTPIGLSSMI
jgi:hypothetical protein